MTGMSEPTFPDEDDDGSRLPLRGEDLTPESVSKKVDDLFAIFEMTSNDQIDSLAQEAEFAELARLSQPTELDEELAFLEAARRASIPLPATSADIDVRDTDEAATGTFGINYFQASDVEAVRPTLVLRRAQVRAKKILAAAHTDASRIIEDAKAHARDIVRIAEKTLADAHRDADLTRAKADQVMDFALREHTRLAAEQERERNQFYEEIESARAIAERQIEEHRERSARYAARIIELAEETRAASSLHQCEHDRLVVPADFAHTVRPIALPPVSAIAADETHEEALEDLAGELPAPRSSRASVEVRPKPSPLMRWTRGPGQQGLGAAERPLGIDYADRSICIETYFLVVYANRSEFSESLESSESPIFQEPEFADFARRLLERVAPTRISAQHHARVWDIEGSAFADLLGGPHAEKTS